MIGLKNRYFIDELGRTLILRGVNLGGSSKIPFSPNGATWNRDEFFQHRAVSFTGRPFPLSEADEHFKRLKAWGLTFLRLLTTWEAIEHSGPGIYDTEYLDYLYQVVKKAAEYNLDVLIDPHQDVWSRFSGGDGAPGWTFEIAGMDVTRLYAAGAAVIHQEYGDPFPRMIWPTNYDKLAAATMFTLFFGGNDFAPRVQVEGIPVQEYLQTHYIHSIQQLALRLKDLPNIVGYDTLNEPSSGFIGLDNINGRTKGVLRKGESPTVFQSMLLGSGFPQVVDVYDTSLRGIRRIGTRPVNSERLSIWLAGHEDIWKQHGVWEHDLNGQAKVLIPDYFYNLNGKPVDFSQDYFKPFANRFARAIRSVAPGTLIFVEGIPAERDMTWSEEDAPNIVHASHWYDGITLLTKTFNNWITLDYRKVQPVFGIKNIQRCFADQIAGLIRQSDEKMNHAPTLIGEVGIPLDMHSKRAFHTGNFSTQIKAIDTTMRALEANSASFTWWNYTSDNTNSRGDHWNDEDFSIFSRDQMTGSGSIYDGGRALEAIVRPYPVKIAGESLRIFFDYRKALFEFTFRHVAGILAPTEIFIPDYQYPHGYHVAVSDGEVEINSTNQIVRYTHTSARVEHTIHITPKTLKH